MSNHTINIPPDNGALAVNAGDTLTITVPRACVFSCSIGNSFSPPLSSVHLSAGDNGPYTAQRTANGTYSVAVAASPQTQAAHSVQINQ